MTDEKCQRCGSESPKGKRFCADCGASLNREEVLEETIRQQVDDALLKRFKDQKFVTSDIAEEIANKLLGWTKIYASIAGPLLTLGALLLVGFGFKNYHDVTSATAKATEEIAQSLDTAVKNIQQESENANQRLLKSTDEIAAIEAKVNEARRLGENVSQYEQAVGEVRQKLSQIRGELTNVEKLRDQVTNLVTTVQTVESKVCPFNEAAKKPLEALGYLKAGQATSEQVFKTALIKFQADHNLPPDGCAGNQTMQALQTAR